MSALDSIPPHWCECSRMGDPILRLIPLKVTLGPSFNAHLALEHRFSPATFMRSQADKGRQIKLIVDLTHAPEHTYYESGAFDLHTQGTPAPSLCRLPCEGIPSSQQVTVFAKVVDSLLQRDENAFIGVMDESGYGATAYMIVCWLVDSQGCSLEAALHRFAQARNPGLFDRALLEALEARYEETVELKHTVAPPWTAPLPEPAITGSKRSLDSTDSDTVVKRAHVETVTAPVQTDGGDGVMGGDMDTIALGRAFPALIKVQPPHSDRILAVAHELLAWRPEKESNMLVPPVNLTRAVAESLNTANYSVTWKPEGARRLLVILLEGCFLLSTTHDLVHIPHLHFVQRDNAKSRLDKTLAECEVVNDRVEQRTVPRILIADLLVLAGESVCAKSHQDRLKQFQDDVLAPYQEMLKNVPPEKRCPLSVRLKSFFALNLTHKVLSMNLPHTRLGLLFVPKAERTLSSPATYQWLEASVTADGLSASELTALLSPET